MRGLFAKMKRQTTQHNKSTERIILQYYYSATSTNMKLVHRPKRAAAPPSPLLAVPNVTAHPSTASVPVTVLLYDGPLLCGFNVAIKGWVNYLHI